ncbi:hypothetical protein [Aeromonas sp. Y318-1]|uniref:hypothetical protein n=1 Tax=Aeromonas TaxID=642 RepID=UPI0022E1B056|nr:hypothetical protein [Aeromonas sp. Y318-1]
MKKAMIAVALLGTMGLVGTASAIDASQTFTWSGTVPAAPTSNGWVIAQPTGAAITNGILTFTTDAAGKGVLTGSTELRFNVFEELVATPGAPDTGKPATAYDYKLISLAVNSAGLAAEQDANGYFAIQSSNNGITEPMVKNTVSATNATQVTGETILSVIKGAGVSNQPSAGDSVDVQASIVVENAA